jgi:hypothetical protein
VLLNADDPVILQTPEGRTLAGNVDVVAHDASIFWIWIEGGGGRIAVHEHGDCQVWRLAEDGGSPVGPFTASHADNKELAFKPTSR